MIPLINWNNAQSGYGFLEFGFGRAVVDGQTITIPYCQNFDVLAHELGHSIAEVGTPSSSTETYEYGGFHESAPPRRRAKVRITSDTFYASSNWSSSTANDAWSSGVSARRASRR